MPNKRRDPTDDDLDWIAEQAREVQEFRETQFQRDGMIFDPVLYQVVELVDE